MAPRSTALVTYTPMKHLMRVVKFLIGLFPKEARIRMRQHLWLLNLYSKSLQKSGLFYGFPPPHKLQKLYVKNIAEQHRLIANQVELATDQRNINCLIILTGQQFLSAFQILIQE